MELEKYFSPEPADDEAERRIEVAANAVTFANNVALYTNLREVMELSRGNDVYATAVLRAHGLETSNFAPAEHAQTLPERSIAMPAFETVATSQPVVSSPKINQMVSEINAASEPLIEPLQAAEVPTDSPEIIAARQGVHAIHDEHAVQQSGASTMPTSAVWMPPTMPSNDQELVNA